MPDDLHERLRRVAGADDSAVRDFALAAIRRELDLLEWTERWAKRPVVEDTVSTISAPDEVWAESGGEGRRGLTMAEWQARRQDRPTLHLNFDAAAAIREERQRREQEWHRYMERRQKDTS